MTDLNIEHFIARTVPNRLSLAETMDKMKSLYKSIAFESRIVNGEFGAFDDKGLQTAKDLLNYYFADLYYYQTCIDYGNYKEVNNYAE